MSAKARLRESVFVDECVKNETTAHAYFSTVTSGRVQTRGAVQRLSASQCCHYFHGDGGDFSEKEAYICNIKPHLAVASDMVRPIG